jgi:hypothetical protein
MDTRRESSTSIHKRYQVAWVPDMHGPLLGQWMVWDAKAQTSIARFVVMRFEENEAIEDSRKLAAQQAAALNEEERIRHEHRCDTPEHHRQSVGN